MIRIGGTRVPMREQEPEKRKTNFLSVPFGYNREEVIAEAQRCIQCQGAPCEKDCPINMRILDMIREIAGGNFAEAFTIIKEDNSIPAITGRVCPQESQCEGVCPLSAEGNGINIGKLEAFVADWARENEIKDTPHPVPAAEPARAEDSAPAQRGGLLGFFKRLIGRREAVKPRPEKSLHRKKVAIIGAGPAGITCAVDLRKSGLQVTLFEALHKAGGVLQYGIPAFRLPTEVVDYEIQSLTEMGVDLRLNFFVGQNISFDELRKEYDAIFIGSGAGAPLFMRIGGENLKGVYSANEFLIRVNLMKSYKFTEFDTPIVCGDRVGVIGAGNVAMDAARCAKRLGAAEVTILYRRTKRESPARNEEIDHALEEGIILKELVAPKRFIGNSKGWLTGVELIKMRLGEPDLSGRRRPIPIEDSEFVMEIDTIVEALGTQPNRLFIDKAEGLEVDRWGLIKVDDDMQTNIPGVYAGGDACRGNATVILAMGDGRRAAASISQSLAGGLAGPASG
jgi:homotetrameric NADPH-dependent glutamate synthase